LQAIAKKLLNKIFDISNQAIMQLAKQAEFIRSEGGVFGYDTHAKFRKSLLKPWKSGKYMENQEVSGANHIHKRQITLDGTGAMNAIFDLTPREFTFAVIKEDNSNMISEGSSL